MSKELLTIEDFCAQTNLGRTNVYGLLKKGDLKAIKIGRRTFIRHEDFQQWISALSAYPSTATSKGNAHGK